MEKHIQIGTIKVHLPDENQSSFNIFEDLAEIFGLEYQSDAVKLLRKRIKDIKPKPSIDYESDFTSIITSNVDTLISVINAISELITDDYKLDFLILDVEKLKKELSDAKKFRPEPKIWEDGDVFAIPLVDGSYTVGQVLNKLHCTCALFEARSTNKKYNIHEFKKFRPISILHLSNGNLLNNGYWEVQFNHTVSIDPGSGSGGRSGEIGSISYGRCNAMKDLANAWYGLLPWNVLFDPNYYEKQLLKGVSQPSTVLILNDDDRNRYRKEQFGIV